MKTSTKHAIDPRNFLYHSLSQVINTNAIFPPKNENDFEFFDIVLINPDGPKGLMVESTDSSLFEVLTEDEKEELKKRLETYNHDGEKHLSSVNDWRVQGKIQVQNAIASLGPNISFNSGQVVDLAIVDVETTRAKQRIARLIERYVFKYFAKLIATAIGRLVKKRFFIGIITGITKGKIDAISEQLRNATGTFSTDTPLAVNGHATLQGTVANRRQLFGNGIIGVDMVCFLAKTTSDTCQYKVSRAIRVMQINDEFQRRRKYLRGGKGLPSVVGITKKSDHLFAACHIATPDDLNLDEDMRQEYITLTREFGKLLGRPHIMRENEALGLISTFGGDMGRDLWCKGILDKPESSFLPSEVSPYLIANGMEGLNEIDDDNDDIPWLKTISDTTDASPSTELPEVTTE